MVEAGSKWLWQEVSERLEARIRANLENEQCKLGDVLGSEELLMLDLLAFKLRDIGYSLHCDIRYSKTQVCRDIVICGKWYREIEGEIFRRDYE